MTSAERRRASACLMVLLGSSLAIQGQGTFIGFEGMELHSKPSFLTAPGHGFQEVDNVLGLATPFEGNRLLVGGGEIFIASPTLQPISQFTLYLNIQAGYASLPRFEFSIAGLAGRVEDMGHWAKYEGLFSIPQERIQIRAFHGDTETFEAFYAVDNITLVTVPEPGVLALVAAGLLGMRLARRRGSPEQRRRAGGSVA